VGPKNHLSDGSSDLPMGSGRFLGVVRFIEKHCKSLLHTSQQKIDNDIGATDAAHCIATDWLVSH